MTCSATIRRRGSEMPVAPTNVVFSAVTVTPAHRNVAGTDRTHPPPSVVPPLSLRASTGAKEWVAPPLAVWMSAAVGAAPARKGAGIPAGGWERRGQCMVACEVLGKDPHARRRRAMTPWLPCPPKSAPRIRRRSTRSRFPTLSSPHFLTVSPWQIRHGRWVASWWSRSHPANSRWLRGRPYPISLLNNDTLIYKCSVYRFRTTVELPGVDSGSGSKVGPSGFHDRIFLVD